VLSIVDVPVPLGLLFMSGAGGLGGVGVFGDCASAPAEASAAAAMTAMRFNFRFISDLLSFVGRVKDLARTELLCGRRAGAGISKTLKAA